MVSPCEFHKDVPDGAEYCFEMACDAIDSNGTEYIVYWLFTDRKDDNEKHESEYDYRNPTRVELKVPKTKYQSPYWYFVISYIKYSL